MLALVLVKDDLDAAVAVPGGVRVMSILKELDQHAPLVLGREHLLRDFFEFASGAASALEVGETPLGFHDRRRDDPFPPGRIAEARGPPRSPLSVGHSSPMKLPGSTDADDRGDHGHSDAHLTPSPMRGAYRVGSSLSTPPPRCGPAGSHQP